MKRKSVADIEVMITNPILRSDFKNKKVSVVNPQALTLMFSTNHKRRSMRRDHPEHSRVRYLQAIPPKSRV